MSDNPKGIGDDVSLLTVALETLAMAPSILRAPRWSRVPCFVCGELKLRAVPMLASCPLPAVEFGARCSGSRRLAHGSTAGQLLAEDCHRLPRALARPVS